MVAARQSAEGWGAGVIPRLASDLHNELPELKGFSERNLRLMIQYAEEYPALFEIWQPPVAELAGGPAASPIAAIRWFLNILLIQRFKDRPARDWCARQTLDEGWSRDTRRR